MSLLARVLGLDGEPVKETLTPAQAEAIAELLQGIDQRLEAMQGSADSVKRVEGALAQTIPMIQFLAKGQDKRFTELRGHLTEEVERMGTALREEATKRAALDVVTALLPSLDDMDHVLEQRSEPALAMVHKKLLAALAKLGVEVIPIEEGKTPFDPALHEGIRAEGQAAEAQEGTIVRRVQTGYRMGERLVRPAKVAVA